MTNRILFVGLFALASLICPGDPPSPPAGGSTGNSGTNGSPVGAPVGDGLGILLLFASGYGGTKLLVWRKKRIGSKPKTSIP
ncbi:MAG: hypothetical protein M0Q38_02390 [Bacteroidales bacterium]|jgi:hypothetical protein|nr:hypothetical protein [Bacteroidales bacterium]